MRQVVLALILAALPIQVTSVHLWDAYWASPEYADSQYKNKELRVTGRVRSVSATYTLYLDGGVGQVDGVTARPATGQLERAARLHPGDQAKLLCMCAGKVFGEPLLIDCKVE